LEISCSIINKSKPCLGLISVEEETDKSKFKMFSPRRAISYMIWIGVPIGCLIFQLIFPYLSYSSWSAFFSLDAYNLASKSMILSSGVLLLLIPRLMTNLVDKSKIDLDTTTTIKKNIITIISCITAVVFNIFIVTVMMLPLASSMKFAFLNLVMTIITFCVLTLGILSLLLTIQLICDDFQDRVLELGRLKHAKTLIWQQTELVKTFRNIKEGLSPILFILILLLGLTALLCFFSVKPLLANGLVVTLNISNGILALAILYKLTSQSDQTFRVLSTNNDHRASVHVTLSVGYAAVISQWTLDIFRKFLKPLHNKF